MQLGLIRHLSHTIPNFVVSSPAYNNIRRGSWMYSLIFTKKVTASLPSRIRWSYVSARYMIYNSVNNVPIDLHF